MSHYHCMCCWQVRLIALLTPLSWNGWIGRWHQSSFISDLFYTCALVVLCTCFWSNLCAVFISSGNKNQARENVVFADTFLLVPSKGLPFFSFCSSCSIMQAGYSLIRWYLYASGQPYFLARAPCFALCHGQLFWVFADETSKRWPYRYVWHVWGIFFFFHSVTSLETAHYQRVTLQ